jgi:glucose/arabinose dehydrogenase
MVYYTGDKFDAWRGSLLIGGLTSSGLVRVTIDGDKAEEAERIPLNGRIRDVEQGPDGTIYVLTDKKDGNIWHLFPLEKK